MSEIDHKEAADLAERLIALKQGIGAAETPSEAQAYKNSLRNACDNHIDLLSRAYLDLHAQLAAERARANETEQRLGNLLARIHRDGGHYIGNHGWEKACNDANAIIYAERARVEALAGLVKSAYDNGFIQGMRESTTQSGGKPWNESRAAKQLTAILNAQEPTNE